MKAWAFTLLTVVGLCGCTGWPDFRGAGFSAGDQSFAKLGARRAPKDRDDVAPFGLSTKAQQIEQDLGAR